MSSHHALVHWSLLDPETGPQSLPTLFLLLLLVLQESSAKLTNQRVRYAFTSSPFSFHARHTLPKSKF